MLLSIAMPTRNSARYIRDALQSIRQALAGTGVAWETLIADGGSTDETREFVEAEPNARIVSWSDAGLYDGMNRAISAATGGFVLILNSDDLLIDVGIRAALDHFRRTPDCDMVSGDVLVGQDLGGATKTSPFRSLSADGAMFGIPAINARIYRRDVVVKAGPIWIDAGLAADREWLARLSASAVQRHRVDAPLYFYRQHEGSKTLANDAEASERIWRAECQLARRILADPKASPTLRSLARSAHALATFKLRVRGLSTSDLSGAVPETSLADLARGIGLTLRWRGKIAGS
ncbi:MAG: glycosyltransferase [Hyphomicrobium sp.]|nr:glycosyltransferase [Hyphomicrobium sp.]